MNSPLEKGKNTCIFFYFYVDVWKKGRSIKYNTWMSIYFKTDQINDSSDVLVCLKKKNTYNKKSSINFETQDYEAVRPNQLLLVLAHGSTLSV